MSINSFAQLAQLWVGEDEEPRKDPARDEEERTELSWNEALRACKGDVEKATTLFMKFFDQANPAIDDKSGRYIHDRKADQAHVVVEQVGLYELPVDSVENYDQSDMREYEPSSFMVCPEVYDEEELDALYLENESHVVPPNVVSRWDLKVDPEYDFTNARDDSARVENYYAEKARTIAVYERPAVNRQMLEIAERLWFIHDTDTLNAWHARYMQDDLVPCEEFEFLFDAKRIALQMDARVHAALAKVDEPYKKGVTMVKERVAWATGFGGRPKQVVHKDKVVIHSPADYQRKLMEGFKEVQ